MWDPIGLAALLDPEGVGQVSLTHNAGLRRFRPGKKVRDWSDENHESEVQTTIVINGDLMVI
jgi:hypothetical protein